MSYYYLFSFKANAQLDTLKYIKRIEINRQKYIGKPFSVLLKDLKKIPPKRYFTISNCDYDTQFFFLNNDGDKISKYKMLIGWKYSSVYKNERLDNIDELYKFDNKTKSQYKNLIVKEVIIAYNESLHLTYGRGVFKEDRKLDQIFYSLKNDKNILEEQPFHNFICWLFRRDLRIIKVDNLIDKNNLNQISQTMFLISDSMNETGKIVINWKEPISKREIKKYEKRYGNSFNYDERNLYSDIIVKNIIIYK